MRLERGRLLFFPLWKSVCFRNCLALGIPAFANTILAVMAFKSIAATRPGPATPGAKCSLEIRVPVAVARAVEHGTLVHAAVSVEDFASAHPLHKFLRRWRWRWRWWSWWWTATATTMTMKRPSQKRPLPAKVVVTVIPRSDISARRLSPARWTGCICKALARMSIVSTASEAVNPAVFALLRGVDIQFRARLWVEWELAGMVV